MIIGDLYASVVSMQSKVACETRLDRVADNIKGGIF
jgi:hypothetical protein